MKDSCNRLCCVPYLTGTNQFQVSHLQGTLTQWSSSIHHAREMQKHLHCTWHSVRHFHISLHVACKWKRNWLNPSTTVSWISEIGRFSIDFFESQNSTGKWWIVLPEDLEMMYRKFDPGSKILYGVMGKLMVIKRRCDKALSGSCGTTS